MLQALWDALTEGHLEGRRELKNLFIGRKDPLDLVGMVGAGHLEFRHLVEELVKLRLDHLDLVVDTQQLEKFIVRDEVEAREICALFVKVAFDFLLDLFHLVVAEIELFEDLVFFLFFLHAFRLTFSRCQLLVMSHSIYPLA